MKSAALDRPAKSRTIGVVYLFYFLTAPLGVWLTHRGFAMAGEIVNIVSICLYALLVLLFYALFRQASRPLSTIAAAFGLVGCLVTVLFILHIAPSSISPLLFFGPYCSLIGYLILRSSLVPRFLGVAMVVAGILWLAFLVPALSTTLAVPSKIYGGLTELVLMLWLLVAGVDLGALRPRSDRGAS